MPAPSELSTKHPAPSTPHQAPSTSPYMANWYGFDQLQEILGLSARTVRARIAAAPDQLRREEPVPVGRPRVLVHYSAIPQVAAWHALHEGRSPEVRDPKSEIRNLKSPDPSDQSNLSDLRPRTSDLGPRPPSGPAPDDLAVAQLRLQAVREYEAISATTSREIAAKVVCDDWTRRPRTLTVPLVERLHEYQRKTRETVCVGNFSISTLRSWASAENAALSTQHSALLALSPVRKGRVGRRRTQIPDATVDFVRLLAISTCRADVAKAVEKARPHLPPEVHSVSLSTWRRRILERDPRKAGADLMHSVSRYRARHTPDVELDWDQLPYNGRWELDDVEEDYYALSTDQERAIRPHGYGILRARTRQWVAFAATETDITHDQVRELMGFAMANPMGGIPDVAKFEHGTVACKPDLKALLESLGVKVSLTSMDGGASVTGLVPDRASGHFQGKGLIEANLRRRHNLQWDAAVQVGPDERNTAPARTERLKSLAEAAAKRGEFLILPRPEEWYANNLRIMDLHNNRPHSGLPLIVDPADGKQRHMTPNECALHLKDQPIRLMDPRLLPRFAAQAFRVPVTRNGFLLNTHSYGRFDQPLQAFREVTAFASRDYPALAYVQELGRCVELYEKQDLSDRSDPSDQFGMKRRLEAKFRNGHEALVGRVIASAQPGIFDMLLAARNPTPSRAISETVCPPELLAQAQGLETGIAAHRAQGARSDARFEAPLGAEALHSSSRSGGGLLSHASELSAQVEMLNGRKEEEPWIS